MSPKILATLGAASLLAQGCLSPGGNGDSYGGMKNDGTYYHVVDAASCSVSPQASSLAVHSRIKVENGKASLEGGCSGSSAAQEIALTEIKSEDDSGKVYSYQGRIYELSGEEDAKDLKQTLAACNTNRAGDPNVWPWDAYQIRILAGKSGDYAVSLDYAIHSLTNNVPSMTRAGSYLVQPVEYASSFTERRFTGDKLEISSNMLATVGLDHVKRSAFTLGVRGTTDVREGLCHYFDIMKIPPPPGPVSLSK